jgi:hypothetical protein
MKQKTGQAWNVAKVKRHLVLFVRQQTGFEDNPNRLLRKPRMRFPGRPRCH